MKAVVGVSFIGQSKTGLDLFLRLGFPAPHAVLVHAVESVLPDGGFLPEGGMSPIVDIQRQRKEDGERLLAETAAKLGCTHETRIAFGNPAHMLTDIAEETGADLLVSGSDMKGAIESMIMGSVTRALVTAAKRSILIAKQEVGDGRALKVVFATDHSEYADRCADLLVRLAPTGIGHLTIVTADTADPSVREALDGAEGITHGETLARKNEALRKRLLPLCSDIETHVIAGPAEAAIDEAMKIAKADLLVIGAQGHGFLERLIMGSTAMHMVANSPWNVLVLRV